jgi:mRNA interferase MazF
MVVIQGEIWWADLPEPRRSEPGYRRPVLVIQGDSFNKSSIDTAVCCILTSNLQRAQAPGNVVLPAVLTGLPRDSVAVVSQIATVDDEDFLERVGQLPDPLLDLVLRGIQLVLRR